MKTRAASPANRLGLAIALVIASCVLILVSTGVLADLRKSPSARARDCYRTAMESAIASGASLSAAELQAARTCQQQVKAARP